MTKPRAPHVPALHAQPGAGILAALALTALLLWATAVQAQDTRRVLVLHSYHPGYQWTDNIQAGLSSVFARQAPGVQVFVEYMDTQRVQPQLAFPPLRAYFAHKYSTSPPDVILTSDDNALDFALQHREELFRGAPVVFCGVGDLQSKQLERHPNVTGVVERTDISGTIAAALRLMPGMRRLALICSATETGEINRQLFRQAMPAFADRLEAVDLCGLPFAELSARLTTLTPDTGILYLGLARDPDGRTMTVDESMVFLRAATPQPIFAPWDFVVGKGAVGGVVVSGERQGRAIAELALRILWGESVTSLPVQPLNSVGMFDHRELVRFDFSPSKLAPGSVVLNRPQGIWARYGAWLILACVLFAAMVAAIGLLVENIRRRRRAETLQDATRRRYQDFVEALSVGVLEVDLAGRIVFANAACHRLYGVAPESLLGKSALDLAETAFSRSRMQELLAKGDGQPGTALVALRNSRQNSLEIKLDWIYLHDPDGRPSGLLAAATDLTELRRAEHDREEQRNLTMALLDANPTPIFAKDTQGRYLRVNKALCEFVGLPESQILGRRLEDIGPKDLVSHVQQLDLALYSGQGMQMVETSVPDRSGLQRDILITRSLYHNAAGQLAGVVGTLTDITARKHMEIALSQSREKYRIMFESLPLAVAVTDPEGRLLEVNQAFAELHGCERETLLDTRPDERRFGLRHMDGSLMEMHEYPSLRTAREQVMVEQELLVHRPDGSTASVHCTAAPMRLPGHGALLVLVDITERRKMEQIIKSRLRAVTSPPTETVDLGFNDLFELEDFQAVQDAFARATGVASVLTTPEGLPLTRPSNFTSACTMQHCGTKGARHSCALTQQGGPEPAIQGLLAGVAPILAGDRPIALWHIYQTHPQLLDLDSAVAILAAGGRDPDLARTCLNSLPQAMDQDRFTLVCNALVLMADKLSDLALKIVQQARFLEQQRRIEADLQQAKELAEAANNAKGDFMANVSHEIRTPLHGVLGMLQLLHMTTLAEDQLDYLEKAQYSARSLLSVINDILDFSKIESGTLELASEAFDPELLVRSSVAVFEEQARAKGLELTFQAEASLPASLLGDAGKIRQMVFNLVGNAVKFTDAGNIDVLLGSLNQADGHAVLLVQVADTGVGIPEDLQDMVFEPFTQAEAVYTKRFQGTGLGLAIVRRLAGLMDGGITLDSQPGRGTRITLALRLTQPARRKKPRGAPGQPAKIEALPPLRLLLAEDNFISQMAARSFLQRAGHTVVAVQNGQEALDALENSLQAPFDAVLMDIQMPVMDGVEATLHIRSHDGSRYDPALPVIALTAYAQVGEHRQFLQAGMDEAIAKPLEPQDIVLSLGRVLARRAQGAQPSN